MKSYVFAAEIEQDEDGRWSAVVPALPGCATQGASPQEALEALNDMAQSFIEVLLEHGDPIPLDEQGSVVEGAAVLVTAG